jgi:hypothetical protein
MPFTSYTDNKLIDHLLGSGTYTKPASKYVALYVGDPMGSGAEVSTSGTAYSRQSGSFTVSGGTATNSGNIEYAAATSTWGVITHVAIFDASTSGNMLVSAALSSSKTIGTGDVLRIPTSQLTVTLT